MKLSLDLNAKVSKPFEARSKLEGDCKKAQHAAEASTEKGCRKVRVGNAANAFNKCLDAVTAKNDKLLELAR